MSKDISKSAIEACRRYEVAASTVHRLSQGIGDALCQCPTIASSGSWTHLKFVYEMVVWVAPDDVEIVAADDAADLLAGKAEIPSNGEVPQWSGDYPESLQCAHCERAHKLIQGRKEARQQFGAAKRFVRSVGKRAVER